MRVSFERVGGFAGLRLSMTLDSGSLDEHEASQLKEEVHHAAFFSLPTRLSKPGGGADRFEYTIEVEIDDQRNSVTLDEAALDDSLRPLVEHLERLLRTHRRSRLAG